jgi:hypothetical protein
MAHNYIVQAAFIFLNKLSRSELDFVQTTQLNRVDTFISSKIWNRAGVPTLVAIFRLEVLMEHLSLKTLALAGLTAFALNGTAVFTAAPAEAQGRGGFEEIDAPGDDLDGPRVGRGVDVDEDDELPPVRRRVIDDQEDERRIIERRTTERRITERRVVEPVIERRIIERRPVVQEVVERPVVHTTVVRPVVERRIVQPVFVRPVVERPVVYAYPRPVVRRVVYRQPLYRASRVVYRQPFHRTSRVVVRDRFYGGRGFARFDNRRSVARVTFGGDRFDRTGSLGRGRAFRY